MRWITACAAALLLAACLETVPAGRAPSNGPAGGSPAPPESGPQAAREMARLVNAHRQSRGCAPLAWLQPAANAAQAHSEDMARRGYFDHVSPDGGQPWDRLAAHGVRYRRVAENIAWTPRQSAGETLRGWLGSPGHRANLDNCAYTHHGIGLQNAYWTHVFVTPALPPRD